MKNRSYVIGCLFLALTSLSWAQTCPGGVLTEMNHWCGSYTAYDPNCRSGPSGGSCTGMSGGYNIGWYAQTGATGQPNSISAAYIDDWGAGTATSDVSPNTSVGQYEYMEFANRYVQAFNKGTGEPIFVTSPSAQNFWPQTANGAWGTNQDCGNENNQWTASYDHVNALWVLVGMAKVLGSNGNITKGVLCIAVSTSDELLQSNTHCGFSTGYCNFWSTYGFDITALLPSITDDSVVYYDLPDYARFGTWGVDNNYYVTFDLLDYENNSNQGIIHGFAACQISGSTLRAGNEYNGGTTPPVTCYDRLNPNWNSPPEGFAQIHTLLPADAQSSAVPSSSLGEYFMATVSPFVSGAPCVPSASQLCTSDQLAFWTWSDIQNETAPFYVTTNTSFIPGCYYTGSGGRPYGNTSCVPQPGTTNPVDSVGDRLMSPLAYRYVVDCEEGDMTYASCEYLAVTQTIQENQTWNSNSDPPFYQYRATGIRYYTLAAPSGSATIPTLVYEGDFYDTNKNLYYWMSSNAIDKDQNVGYTFNIGDGSSTGCSGNPCYPSVYDDTLNDLGASPSSPTLVQAGSGSITDTANQSWGEVASMSMDPYDDLTFWGTGEYLTSNETACSGTNGFSVCTWSSAVFSCQKGGSLCP
jgi:hypothetical protein